MAVMPEYDLHANGMRVDDALARFDRIVSAARNGGDKVFAVVVGYGSTGGTSRIKTALLDACKKYIRQNHIRAFLDGEYAGDMFSPQFMAFPDFPQIPIQYRRCPNPGMIFVSV